MANLQRMPADAKVSQVDKTQLENRKQEAGVGKTKQEVGLRTFNFCFVKAQAVAFLTWRRKMEQDLGNRLVSVRFVLTFTFPFFLHFFGNRLVCEQHFKSLVLNYPKRSRREGVKQNIGFFRNSPKCVCVS